MCTTLMVSGVSEQYGEGFGLGSIPCSLMALRSDMREKYNIKVGLNLTHLTIYSMCYYTLLRNKEFNEHNVFDITGDPMSGLV